MTTKNNIPAGYKDSAVGVIPQEWEVKRLGIVCNFLDNQRVPIKDVDREGMRGLYPYYGASGIIDYVNDYIFDDELILLGEDGANIINRSTPLAFMVEGKIWVNNHAHVLKPIEPHNRFFICSYLESISYDKYNTGTAQPKLNREVCEKILIPVPPIEEQRKIAEILGVWDEAIEKQSRLIEKLELRKRGLMQHLLIGRTRLPGFTTPWQKCLYSDILKEVKRTMTWDDNEEYDLISVKRRSGGLFHRDRLLGKDIKTKNLRPAKCGDFLISKMQIVHGASGLVTEEFDEMKISGSYIALVARNGDMVDMKFINWYSKTPYFYHQTYVSSYGVHIEKMTFDLESFMSMNIMLPPFPEQKAIAEVLTAADNEVATHRKKLDALRLQKRGLMQQLLTGKTRVKI